MAEMRLDPLRQDAAEDVRPAVIGRDTDAGLGRVRRQPLAVDLVVSRHCP